MSGPFATYFGNQRAIAIPIIPTKCTSAIGVVAAATTTIDAITLSAANIAAGTVEAFLYYCANYSAATAAASSMAVNWQWQFRTAAHANVGAAVPIIQLTAGNSGAGAAGTLNYGEFFPNWPHTLTLTIPATAAELALQRQTIIVAGAPNVNLIEGWGMDITNSGSPGDIGGGGISAQGANNPNAF